MSDRIINQVKYSKWDKKTEEKNKSLREKADALYPFERPFISGMLPTHKEEGDEELNEYFKRIDIVDALTLRKKQEGIPFPVPRFSLIDLHEQFRSTFSFNNHGGQEGQASFSTFDGQALSTVYNDISKPTREAFDRNSFKWSIINNIFGVLSVLSLLSIVLALAYIVYGGSWYWTLGGVAGTIVNMIIAIRCKELSEEDIYYNHSFTAIPNGFVPDRVRRNIESYKGKFERICLLFEADWDYSISEKTTWAKAKGNDPLVVGIRNGVWYIIDEFDLTEREEFLKEKFAF